MLRELGPVRASSSSGPSGVALVGVVLDVVLHVDPTVLFIVSAIGILGLAWVVGLSTERLGAVTGPQVGGILNATFGNIAELIIAFFALRAGLIEVVKASSPARSSATSCFVLGASMLIGGLRNGTQVFDRAIAGSNAALLVLAAVGLFIPAVFSASTGRGSQDRVIAESALVAVVLIGLLRAGARLPVPAPGGDARRPRGERTAMAGRRGAGGSPSACSSLAAVLLAVLSEALVRSIEPFIEQFGLSPFFVGVILIPTIGNLAEHLVAVQLAVAEQDGVLARRLVRLQPAGRALRRAGAGAPRPRHRPADEPRVPAARGRRGRGRGRRSARWSRSMGSRTGSRASCSSLYAILAVTFFELV